MIKGKILVVEENPQNMRVFELILGGNGYNVLKATNSEEALDVAMRKQPDVILMDMQLPKLNGLKVTRKLRENSTFSNTIILGLTAYATRGARKRIIESGYDACLPKPINTRELPNVIAVIVEMLSRRQKVRLSS